MTKEKLEELLRIWLKVTYKNEAKFEPHHQGFLCYISHQLKFDYWYRGEWLLSTTPSWSNGEITNTKEEFINWVISNFEGDIDVHAKTVATITKKVEKVENKISKVKSQTEEWIAKRAVIGLYHTKRGKNE